MNREGGLSPARGGLFTRDFLSEGIAHTAAWREASADEFETFAARVGALFAAFPTDGAPNESQTEQDLIFPLLAALGWEHALTQPTASRRGRTDVPDVLLFASAEAKSRANSERVPADKLRHGVAIVENKAWRRPLDRSGFGRASLESAPSTQILRYLSVAEVQSDRRIQWGILTNGGIWRLYWQGARSRSEEFLELDLAAVIGLDGGLFAVLPENRPYWLKTFWLLFRRASFIPAPDTGRHFVADALDETRHWEARVAQDLSGVVFRKVFPRLAKALAAADPERPAKLSPHYLREVREATLILLYRLLFVLYAEDRGLLPTHEERYDDYSLRRLREEARDRIDRADALSVTATAAWSRFRDLCRMIDRGDASIGLPPYNGGLFDRCRTPLLERSAVADEAFLPTLDLLSRREEDGRRKWINYRDLSVQQLGSIYEQLLEWRLEADAAGNIDPWPAPFARKTSGSYYTPEELVRLILERAVGPLLEERRRAFLDRAAALKSDRRPRADRIAELQRLDPATRFLELRICDPAMGSGHFLVSLVDYLADAALEAMAQAEKAAGWADGDDRYVSPLEQRIDAVRKRILEQAKQGRWAVREEQLDDRHIVRRMILKRAIYGVDKNSMAVELAKVALWLHTFTVGAPLSFLDHHLRCGDSLFGEWVRPAMDDLGSASQLLINPYIQQAMAATKGMQAIEDATDSDIAEARSSAEAYAEVRADTAALESILTFRHVLRWLGLKRLKGVPAVEALFDGSRGDPIALLREEPPPGDRSEDDRLLQELTTLGGAGRDRAQRIARGVDGQLAALRRFVRRLAAEERFLHWQVAFPGVWRNWESTEPQGGFDAVIGNPPWDRMKLQEVEWFAARKPEIAKSTTAAQRRRMIDELKRADDPLAEEFDHACARAAAAADVARICGDYPLLSGGDVNIYSLFVERALRIVAPEGMVALLTPSGIAADKGASAFFRSISTTGRLAALLDFENRRPPREPFFPDVDSRFKFCVLAVGGARRSFPAAECAFFLRSTDDVGARSFALSPADFRAVNPNTGTAPVFRTRRDAELTTAMYRRLPILVDRSGPEPHSLFPVRYSTMFHMTNDSGLFRTAQQLRAAGFYPVKGNRWRRSEEIYLPLYEGKMVQAFDHRAASVEVDARRLHRPGQPLEATPAQHSDPTWTPTPQFWVRASDLRWPPNQDWSLGFKDVTAPTNVRTMIAAFVPRSAVGNTLPLVLPGDETPGGLAAYRRNAPKLLGALNSFALDYLARQKVQGQHLNWYIVEQLPMPPAEVYDLAIGSRSAGEIVADEVLRLTYVSHDMAPFARDMGYDGPPFPWDEEARRHARARLDALYFMLYGVSREDADYILDTFPIVRRQDEAAFGRYLTKELILGYMAAFAAGDAESRIHV